MLFKIDRSIIDDLDSPINQEVSRLTLEELARAYRRGNHIVIADRDILNQLKDCPMISENAKNIFNGLYSRYSESRAIFDHINKYVEVVSQYSPPYESRIGGYDVIKISSRYILRNEILSRTIFLAENLNDIDFYKLLVRAFLCKEDIPGIEIRLEPLGGGGYNIADQFDRIQQDGQQLCLTIVDSDKKHPFGVLGGTARAVANVNDMTKVLCKLITLDIHEVENLIPIELFEEIRQNSRERQTSFELLRIINGDQARLFLDLKRGLFIYDVINSTNLDFENYWRAIIARWGIAERCLNGADCLQNENEKCINCKIYPGFGDPLPDIIGIMNVLGPQRISNFAHGIISSEWNRIAEEVVTWFSAHSPVVSS